MRLKKYKCSAIAFLLSIVPLTSVAKLLDGEFSYSPPVSAPLTPIDTSSDLDADYDAAWRGLVSHLSDTAFVIDNIDKDSGLVTISFSQPDARGDLDCGVARSWVKNLRGRRDYQFDGASPSERYEVLDNGMLLQVARSLSVSGKINVYLSPRSPTTSRMKVVTRYVVSKTVSMGLMKPSGQTLTEVASLTSGEDGHFQQGTTFCRSTGMLEKRLLDGVKSAIGQLAR